MGTLLGALILADQTPDAYVAAAAILAFTLAVGAVLLSLAHLDKPLRAYRALRRFPASPLSREIVLFAAYTAAAGAFAAAAQTGAHPLWLGVIGMVLGAAALVATAQVYSIPARPAWRHWSTIVGFAGGGLSLGPALALALAAGWWPEVLDTGRAPVVRSLVIIGVAAAAVALWARAARWNRVPAGGAPRRAVASTGSSGLWITRVAVGLVAPVAVLLAAPTSAAAAPLAALALLVGETADRTLFFAAGEALPLGSEIPGAR